MLLRQHHSNDISWKPEIERKEVKWWIRCWKALPIKSFTSKWHTTQLRLKTITFLTQLRNPLQGLSKAISSAHHKYLYIELWRKHVLYRRYSDYSGRKKTYASLTCAHRGLKVEIRAQYVALYGNMSNRRNVPSIP